MLASEPGLQRQRTLGIMGAAEGWPGRWLSTQKLLKKADIPLKT